jgi:hypothetical protein
LTDLDRAAMSAGDFRNDGEAETCARMMWVSASPKALEDTGSIVERDTGSAIRDTDKSRGINSDGHLRSRRRVGNRVFDQIAQCVRYCIGITVHPYRPLLGSFKT